MAVFRAGLTLLLLAQATSTLDAAEISFICTDALAPSMRELVPEFEKASGHRVKTTIANAGTIAARFKQLRLGPLIPGGEFRATLTS
jgi:hypothetical protein